ncbi:MAG: sigma-54-dependent Fis family transcriptional regulator [Planctomycetota bacterium]|nr:MAG: sigma-54-dependent Fis family transcriptional regulator [Planctomycetota bacterium]
MTPSETRLLVVEDDEAHADALRLALETEGYQVEVADGVDAALDRLRARPFELVLTDLVLGQRDGLDLLREARRRDPGLSVFLITGKGSIETAVAAMRDGAADYITKPVNVVELRMRVAREVEKRRLAADNRELRAELERQYGLEGMVGNAPVMQRVFDMVRQVGPTEATVLLLGESGTGKEMVARACHQLSPRAARRFVAINCAALTETLIESELFGHVKGAFTGAHIAKEGKFEYASGGTLFLDEIGDMPLSTQTKLLRVLEDHAVIPVGSNEEQPVDVRILAATNRDLLERVNQGRFREDLYYRLAVITIELPPLRERLEDLPLLVDHFRDEFARKHKRPIRGVDPAVLARLRDYAWPGNVRELRNTVETMVVLDRDGELGLSDLPRHLRRDATPVAESAAAPARAAPAGYALAGKTLGEVEKDLIRATLDSVEGNRQKAAQMLGMGERTLYRKIKEYAL